jgi:aspartate/methionine/tyrosine aminotransferase
LKQKFSHSGPVRLFPVEGGWHATLQLSSEQTDEEWACLLLKKDQVLTHPGYLFDFHEGSYLVLSLLVPEDRFQEGIEKIAKRVSA